MAPVQGSPVIKKAVVVAPATLVNNWASEIKKWMGVERMRAMVLSSQVGLHSPFVARLCSCRQG